MTFTPGSDEGRTDTFEAQTATPDRALDKQTEEDFSKAQTGIKTIAEGLYNFGKGALFLKTGGSVQATQALDALRAKIEGKKGPIPSPNPNNLGGLITLEQITTEEAFTRPDVTGTASEELREQKEIPFSSSVSPSLYINSPDGVITPEQKKALSLIKARMQGKDPYEGLEGEDLLKKYYEDKDLELKPEEDQPIIISGAQVRTRRVKDRDVKDFLLKYPDIDPIRASRYVDLNKREITNVAKTIRFLNDLYKSNSPTGDLEDIAAEFSVIFGVDAQVEDLQNIIEERGDLAFKTKSMEQPFIIRNLDDLQAAYFERLNVLKQANVFDEGHVFAVNSLLRDKNVKNVATYKTNVEPEIARSIEQLIDKQTLEELISPGQGPAYLEKIVLGNRSRKDEKDPDKAVARVFGGAYGVEEDFLNFMFPERTVASKVAPELKDTFVDLYDKELAALLQNFPESKPGQGGLLVGSYSLERIKEQVQNLVAEEMNLASGLNTALNETEYQRIKKENPEIILYLDERFGGKEQYVTTDKRARRIRRKGISTMGLNEFRVGSSWDIGE
tara:strand:+ start:29 stop:1705 length:1677 start_codon:yes stop_codon:yes gene_type:complete